MVQAYILSMDKNAHQLWNDLEAQIRREPMRAVILAFAGGFFLCLLPLGKLLGVLIRIVVAAVETGFADHRLGQGA